jgi:hypothetical protein
MLSAVVIVGGSMFAVSDGWAQQKQKVSYKVSAANAKYTQQQAIDVGDVPGHQIRIYELHRTFPVDGPKIEGVRIAETWTRALTDYVDLNGPSVVYSIYMMENGDKIFARGDLVSQTVTNADGSRKTTSTAVTRMTGGTGKFRGIQGTSKSVSLADIKAGVNETQTELEYWKGM